VAPKLLAVKDDSVYPWVIRIVVAMANVAFAFHARGDFAGLNLPLEITSGCDGKHSRKSRHYLLAALDQRSKDMTGAAKKLYGLALQQELGPEYQVILEHEGAENEHFHIEWDPQ
jgi:hypothetical protein